MSDHPESAGVLRKMSSEAIWKDEARLADALEVAGGVGTWDWDLKTDLK